MSKYGVPAPLDDEVEGPITPEFNADGEPLPHQGRRFCMTDPKCPCHEDPELIAQTMDEYEEGLFTPEEATRYVQGGTL